MRSGLVGRDRELAALAGLLAAALAGDARLVLCGGEPGIGRTRLAEELARRAAARGVPVVWGRAGERKPPCWPWRQVLRAVPDAAAVATRLAPAPLDGASPEGFRLFDTVSHALREAARRSGLVVVLEDLHVADEASLRLLQHLAGDLAGSRLLVLATHHHAGRGPLGEVLVGLVREPVTERLELTGLAPDAVAAQLAGRLGPVSAELAARVHELTGGNPFFVDELARHLADGRQLGIPATVRDAVAGRVGRLSPRCRHVLRAAAVVGRRFPVAVVAAVVGRPVLECLDPLDEAVDAGLLEPAATAGEHRFVHALVRDAVEAALPAGERVRLHRAAAAAVERFAGDRLDPYLPDLARHWAAAAVAGERALAAGWVERAGDEATRRLAFADGARLYRLALDTGEPDLDGPARHRLLVALAGARRHAADREGSAQACREAAALARDLGRPDLLGDAALVLGCVNDQGADRTLRALCQEALAGLDPAPSTLRARLLALLAETCAYLEDVDSAEAAGREAVAVAEACADPDALVAALRARQMACSGPDGVEVRAALAARLLRFGPEGGDAAIWGHLWRIDVCVERGELFDAAAEVDELEWCAGRLGDPAGRWHVLKVRAMLAQAHGRFADARRLAEEAFAAAPADGHAGAVGARLALLTALDHHAGGPEHGGAPDALDAAGGPVAAGSGYRITYTLGPALVLTDAGRHAEAGALYRSLGPPLGWRPPPFFLLASYAAGIAVAIGQGADDDVAVLHELLEPHRHRHVGSGAGVAHYGGPVTLHLGMAASRLGDLDVAADDLRDALAGVRRNGAAGYAVEAQAELAAVLARRDGPGDRDEARRLVDEGGAAARGLDMPAFVARLDALAAGLGPTPAAPSRLTAREREVAACVARGMGNAQIARALFVSERTAQNHVQHILTKLGYSRRSQIAVWAVQNLPGGERE